MVQPNPTACCGIKVDCCDPQLPDVLTATFSAPGSTLDGQSVKIVWVGDGDWVFSGRICNSSWGLRFYCNLGGTSIDDFFMDISAGEDDWCDDAGTANPDTGGSCSPLNLQFSSYTFAQNCNCGNSGQQYSITVTE